jgi:acyl carrier protein
MTAPFTLEDLATIAARVIGRANLTLTPEGTARAVPGWDSLSHTIITLEIADARGIALEPQATAACATFAELVALVNAST